MEDNTNDVTKQDYLRLNDRCAVCHWPAYRAGRTLEIHHIQGGAGRKDLRINWLVVCRRCHTAIHQKLPDYGELPKGALLTAKIEEDGSVDLPGLAKLRNRTGLPYDICDIPQMFLDDREKQGGKPWP